MHLPSRLRTHLRLVRFSMICSAVLAVLLALTPLGDTLERGALAVALRLQAAPALPAPVTMVVLRSQQPYGELPILREELAGLLETLAHQPRPASAPVVVDIVLTEPATETGPGSAGARIIAATRALGNVVHAGIVAWSEDNLQRPEDTLVPLKRHSAVLDAVPWTTSAINGTLLAHPTLAEGLYGAAAGVGFINLDAAQAKGETLLRAPLLVQGSEQVEGQTAPENRFYPSLALAGLAAVRCPGQPLQACLSVSPQGLRLGGAGGLELPVDEDGNFWINHRKRFEFDPRAGTDDASPNAPAPEVVLFRLEDGQGHFYTRGGLPIALEKLREQVLLVVDGQERSEVFSPLGPMFPQSSAHAQIMTSVLQTDLMTVFPSRLGLPLALGLLFLALGLRLGALKLEARQERAHEPSPPQRLISTLSRFVLSSSPELLLLLLSLLGAGLSFWLARTWLPIAQPGLTLAACGALFQFSLPRALDAELSQQEMLLAERDQKAVALEKARKALEIELTRLEPLRKEAVTLENMRPEDRAALAMPPEELADLETLVQDVHALLSGGAQKPPKSVQAKPSPRDTALEPLRQAADKLRQQQSEMQEAERRLARELPEISGILHWYRARTEARRGQLRGLHEAIRSTRERLLRLESEQVLVARPAQGLSPGSDQKSTPGSIGATTYDRNLFERSKLISADPAFCQLMHLALNRLAPAEQLFVRIHGETGTGKDLVARAIHDASPRKDNPFIPLNCAALAPGLLESALFGHVKGAFPGAVANTAGYFASAHTGTLFLDEVGEMSLAMQAKLLRVLESGEITRVGSTETRKVDVRIISATHRNLEAMVAEGSFREDLLQRLGHAIHLPPLRERRQDIPLIVKHFLEDPKTRRNRNIVIQPRAMALLTHGFDWPGNVRQLLRQVLEPAVILTESDTLTEDDMRRALPLVARKKVAQAESSAIQSLQLPEKAWPHLHGQRRNRFNASDCGADPTYDGNRQTADKHRRQLIALALPQAGWSVARATVLLAGDADAQTRASLQKQILDCLKTFEAKVPELDSPAQRDQLVQTLNRHYTPYHEAVLKVVEALRQGRIIRPGDPSPDDAEAGDCLADTSHAGHIGLAASHSPERADLQTEDTLPDF